MAEKNTSAFRVYQLAVGAESIGFNNQPTGHAKDTENLVFFTELQFTANISYTDQKSKTGTDDTTIEMYNLAPEMRARFKAVGATVMIRAGYDDIFPRNEDTGYVEVDYDALPIVYLGTVLYSYTYKKGADLITKLICSNDKLERATTKTSIAFPAGVAKKTVISNLMKTLDLAVIESDLANVTGIYHNGFTVYGSVSDALTRVCEENGLKWFTFNKQIRVIPAEPTSSGEGWAIGASNIIGSVEGYYRRTRKALKTTTTPTSIGAASEDTQTTESSGSVDFAAMASASSSGGSGGKRPKVIVVKTGVRITVHLDGRIRLGDTVQLSDSIDFDGTYRVKGIAHNLDYTGDRWTTELDLEKVT
ncbi:hypothetical protein Erwinia_phage_Tian_00052 [Erwinia phage Tian]|uniref:Uncharacterized protein n=3 Tax=Caudoviricetes TaxID=2731619 RepID=A0A346FHV5_9CAUD|nr:hypothetical protein SUNLIREN_85 [Erwinia phage SunLIRen]QGF21796.1 hypothetical protein [Salmonella phage ST-3]WJN64387.1 hypothetical protein Erwinia_phage_Panisse_00034 [Erwinia phage Panisse]WJN64688.1 hypothetical protein Erwinia_phage_Pistou_00051 [Erwinia phage Pistou]WJN64967.1 hypothetical protein Erwinia_phage_Tian_00052 [Erwinia phage Tian]